MSDGRLAFCLGVHDHQPTGNFDHVLVEAAERAYAPFLERLRRRPEVRLTFHASGSLLEWLRDHSPRTFGLLEAVVGRGQVELLTGGYYEPILAVVPDHDKIGQIERLTSFLKGHFGVRARGMWLAERVWEPHLPRALREAGVEYVLVDDSHFALAGFDPEALGGYYLTEEQGETLRVFPISQRLRYLIPFADVQASLDHLEARRGRVPAVTVVDDGEKFGVWPGTHAHVYEDGWLDRFFDRLLATPWLELATLGEVVDRVPASGRVYLPTASYREMGEWALSTADGRALAAARREIERLPDGERLVPLLRPGFWRGFLVKYPEVADFYWKMLRLSRAIQAEASRRPDDPRLAEARLALWRGQANDAYWHGVFGGCYLPHLRRAVKGALLTAERVLAEATGGPALAWWRGDANGDGREEILVRTRALSVTVNPEQGGSLTELGYLPRALDVADVFTRRPEVYHDRIGAGESGPGAVHTIHAPAGAKQPGLERILAYDDVRRASLLDGLFLGDQPLDPVAPWSAARWATGTARFRSSIEERPEGGLAVGLAPDPEPDLPLDVDKRLLIRDAAVEASYRLRLRPPAPWTEPARWAVQWNLALTAGDAPGRYLTLPGRPSLASAGRAAGVTEVALVDEWIGVEARLAIRPAAELAWGPVETVSVSEGGFERIHQGLALLLVWPLTGDGREPWELRTDLTLASR